MSQSAAGGCLPQHQSLGFLCVHSKGKEQRPGSTHWWPESSTVEAVRGHLTTVSRFLLRRTVPRVQILGLIENMSYFMCPHCGERSEIFSHGGARTTAKAMDLEFLGEVSHANSLPAAAI